MGGEKALKFYQQPLRQNFHFCYINNNKNYIINHVDQLFSDSQPVNMFLDKTIYIIHPENSSCVLPDQNNSHQENPMDYVKRLYPKQKFLPLFIEILVSHKLINDNLCFSPMPNMHITDICRFINNTFGHKDKTEPRFIKLCKCLQKMHLQFPSCSIKNPVAQTYLC